MIPAGLAPHAVPLHGGRGRRHAEPPSPPRTEHQRDRDRIVHSNAFRRLVYKTQVFLNHEGDLFRTRLTHSLEVAQIGRSAARALALNEDLVEAVALAHDLGHTPFGHAGQDALHACLADAGGFEHNLQSLRVVDRLEARYPSFDGLNLTFETREGILKRCSPARAQALLRDEPHGPARRFVDGGQPSLEAQVVNLADEIAYNAHDIDDGLRSGLISVTQMREVPLFADVWRGAQAEHPRLSADDPADARRLLFETLRRMLAALVNDLVASTAVAVEELAPADADAVRAAPPLARLSPALRAGSVELKRFLHAALYRHPKVVADTDRARRVVAELYAAYRAAPSEMPADFAARDDGPRAAADYIAGMTDRFALREHRRLTGRDLFAGAAVATG